jgi:histidine phosphotransfer protein HptB
MAASDTMVHPFLASACDALNPDSSDSAAPAARTQQLDATAVAKLRELDPDGRNGVLTRVLSAFETSLVRMLGQLAAQRDDGDAAVVCSIAHTLKSSAASVGALALSRTCAEVEQRLRAGTGGELANDVQRLMADGDAALAAVGAMLRP